MSVLNLNNKINEIKSSNYKSIRGTLLIPINYLKLLDDFRYKEFLSIEELISKFSFLIEKKIINIIPNLEKHTTQYQGIPKQKLNLIRCHFRSNPMIWHHWKRLANHYGISMCYLFLICLKKVSLKQLESVGAPTDSSCLCNFIFYEVTNFARFYSHRWFFSKRYRKKTIREKLKKKYS